MLFSARRFALTLAFAVLVGCSSPAPVVVPVEVTRVEVPTPESSATAAPASHVSDTVPAWAADAVFYQLFPERFRNGDLGNDPTRASLEFPVERVPESWAVTPWTGDWYERAGWEEAMGDNFYHNGTYDRRYGGDLQGVIDKLDYLKDLGINTIYFNPVFYARSLHKYDGNTYHHIDPHFGPDPAGDFALMATETSDPATWHTTAADQLFFDLIGEAHARGIRVIIDGVWNHTGRDFFAFENLRREQADSPYAEWYIVNQFDDPATEEDEFEYEGWWGVHTLPVFADTPDGKDLHPGPKQYVFDATTRWHDPNGDGDPSDGIDGWRLDVTNEVPIQFWEDWNAHVRALNPDAYTVTELWEEASDFIRDGDFSATMNYHAFAAPVKAYFVDQGIATSTFADLLNERREHYPESVQYALQNLVDSHDTDRIASSIVNAEPDDVEVDQFGYDRAVRPDQNEGGYDVRAPNRAERQVQRLIALLQMTYVGPPMIYYGTEAGMWGADDPDDRKPMVWADLDYDDECADPLGRDRACDAVAFDGDLYAFYRDAIALRHESDALRHGDFEVIHANDELRILAFSRALGEETVVVVMNRDDKAHGLRIEKPVAGAYDLAFSTIRPADGTVVGMKQDATGFVLDLPARTGVVLHRAP